MKIKKSAAMAAQIPSAKITTAGPAKVATSASKPPTTSAPATGAITTIDVKLDVGFGNAVFLRGQGGGLDWEHGVPLACVDGKTWRWSGKVKDPITFKPLINDKIWAAGSDLTIKPGQKIEVKPNFA
jgi:hypothetical protein